MVQTSAHSLVVVAFYIHKSFEMFFYRRICYEKVLLIVNTCGSFTFRITNLPYVCN